MDLGLLLATVTIGKAAICIVGVLLLVGSGMHEPRRR